MSLILFILLIVFFTVFQVYWDYHIIAKDKVLISKSAHITKFLFRAFMVFYISTIFTDHTGTIKETFISLGKYMLLGSCIYWFLFDSLLNFTRKLPIFYLGDNNFLDKLFKKYKITYFATKVILLVGSVVLFVV